METAFAQWWQKWMEYWTEMSEAFKDSVEVT